MELLSGAVRRPPPTNPILYIYMDFEKRCTRTWISLPDNFLSSKSAFSRHPLQKKRLQNEEVSLHELLR